MTRSDVLFILSGLPWTVGLTLGAFLIGAALGVPLLAACRSRVLILRVLAAGLIQFARGIPPIVWLFIIFFGIGTDYLSLTPFAAGLIGFGLIAAANMAEIYRGAVTAIDRGQWEACAALDLGRWYSFLEVIAPQALRVALPSAATYLIGLLKDTAVASTIGMTDLAFQGARISQINVRGLQVFALVGLVYIVLSLPVAWLSRRADLYLQAKVAR